MQSWIPISASTNNFHPPIQTSEGESLSQSQSTLESLIKDLKRVKRQMRGQLIVSDMKKSDIPFGALKSQTDEAVQVSFNNIMELDGFITESLKKLRLPEKQLQKIFFQGLGGQLQMK